jgi:uncharacterized protein (DUF362 family)/ferredoxin
LLKMKSKSTVVLIRCDTYEEKQLTSAIRRGLGMLGGISNFVRSGERIVLKPNVLVGTAPEHGVTTHPAFFKSIGQILIDAGVSVYYGDSSSFGSSEGNLNRSGLKQVADEMGFTMADFDMGREVSFKEGLLIKKFIIANGVLDADGLISLPKFKTHGLVKFTGAVKNQFGCIPGMLKSQYHVKLPDPYDFATMLVDLNSLIKPRLYIIDGIIAMEGNGPRSGRLKPLNVILLSDDPIAVDATACRIIGLNPETIPTSIPGEKAGAGTYHADKIDLQGDEFESFSDFSFLVDHSPLLHKPGGRTSNFIKNRVTQKPVIDRKKCDRCGVCVSLCPVTPKAVNWVKGDMTNPPKHDYDLCIRCYCCQETCPDGAIFIETPLLGRFFFKK